MTTSSTIQDLGQRVKLRRRELGLTQAGLAKLAGISQPTISTLERGGTSSTRDIVKLAAALQTTAAYLMTGKGTPDDAESVSTIPLLATLIFMDGDTTNTKFPFDPPKPTAFSTTDPSAFAVLIRGTGLAPAFRDQCKIIASDRDKLSPGCFALIQLKDGRASVGEVTSVDDLLIIIRRIGGGEASIPVENTTSIQKVIAVIL